MKNCSRCSQSKDLSLFFKTKRTKDGLQHTCKACMNIAYKATRGKKTDHYNSVAKARRDQITERIRQWKSSQGCTFCVETFAPCLELHHLDPSQKDMDPSITAQYSWAIFVKEANKCILVCANCHRKVHHGLISVDETHLVHI